MFLGVVLFGLDNVAASAKAGKGPHAKLDAVLDALPGCLQSGCRDRRGRSLRVPNVDDDCAISSIGPKVLKPQELLEFSRRTQRGRLKANLRRLHQFTLLRRPPARSRGSLSAAQALAEAAEAAQTESDGELVD